MHVEGSSISCGVRRLVIAKDETPTSEKLASKLSEVKDSCAILITTVPRKRKDIKALLIKHGFEQVKEAIERAPDPSVVDKFAKLATLVMHHDHDIDDEDVNGFEQYAENTVQNSMVDFTVSMMHHGNFVGSNGFFIRYMDGTSIKDNIKSKN